MVAYAIQPRTFIPYHVQNTGAAPISGNSFTDKQHIVCSLPLRRICARFTGRHRQNLKRPDTSNRLRNSRRVNFASEFNLSTSTTQYQVPILINQMFNAQTQTPTEKRLNLQDAFLVSAFSVFLAAPAVAGSSVYFLSSFPSLQNGFTEADALAMTAFYNGYMLLNVSQNVLIPYWDLWKHYKVNQTTMTTAATLPFNHRLVQRMVFIRSKPTSSTWVPRTSKCRSICRLQ